MATYRVVRPWGRDQGREASVLSEHATVTSAFAAIDVMRACAPLPRELVRRATRSTTWLLPTSAAIWSRDPRTDITAQLGCYLMDATATLLRFYIPARDWSRARYVIGHARRRD